MQRFYSGLVLSILLFLSFQSFSQNWAAIGGGTDNTVLATAVFDGDLIVAGKFTTAGGSAANYIAKWNGTSWDSLDTGMDGEVNALAVYDGELYAGGQFIQAGNQGMNYIARWDGKSWGDVEGGMDNYVTSMVVYNNELIIGGHFKNTDKIPANNIVKWDGTNWVALGSGMGSSQAQVLALTVYGNDLVAAGAFDSAGGVSANHIAKWNGTAWATLGTGINNTVHSLFVYGGNLIAGGLFSSAGGNSANNIAKWNGTSWSGLGSGTTGASSGAVLALEAYGSDLIAGGIFTSAGGNSANYIAKWDGTSWSALGSGVSGGSVNSVNALLNNSGELIAGGLFTTAGSASASNVAKWISSFTTTDAGIQSIISPAGSYCEGSTSTVKVTLKNYGNYDLDSVTINWSANAVTQSPYSWSGKLNPDSVTIITLGNYMFNKTGVNHLMVWTSMPNGLTDTLSANDTAYFTDTVFVAPVANAGMDASICYGSSHVIGAAVSGNTYSWSSNPAGFSSHTANPTVNPLVTSTYILTEANTHGCSNTDSVLITVIPTPNAMWTSIAKKLSVSFMPADSTFSAYHWEFGDGDSSTLVHPTHNYPSDNSYTVSLTVTNKSGCTAKYTHTITISSIVRINDAGIELVKTPEGNICEGTHNVQVKLVNFGRDTLASANIHWKVNGIAQSTFPWTGSLVNSDNVLVTLGAHNFTTTGNIIIQAWTSLPNGVIDSAASNDSAMSLVTVFPIPAALTGGDQDICHGSSAVIGGTEVSGNTYTWTSKPVGFTSNKSTVHVSPIVTTTYYLTESNVAGCSKTDSCTITVIPIPDASWTAKDKEERKFAFTPANTSYSTYKWYFGDGDSSSLVSPTHTYATDGNYTVKLVVTNSGGCSSTYEASITVSWVGVHGNGSVLTGFAVYPNPFVNQFSFSYYVNQPTHIRVYLYDITGKLVATLSDEVRQAGKYTEGYNSENYGISAGTYILRVYSNEMLFTKKLSKFE
ncbi:PKD domain-containing protein [Bacteroidota bacterium]